MSMMKPTTKPAQPGSTGATTNPTPANRGLIGQAADAFAKPLDFTGLPNVSAGKTPLVRDRGELADSAEGYYDEFRTDAGRLDDRFALSGPGDFGAERSSIESSVYDRAYNLLRPELDRQENRTRSDLVSRGLPDTSEAYDDLYGQFSDRRDRSLNDLSLASVMAGAQEHERLANLTGRNRAQLFGEDRSLYDSGISNLAGLEGLNRAQEAEGGAAFGRALTARQQEITERRLARAQPGADLASLLAGVSQNPTFPGQTKYGIQAPDYQGQVGSNYAAGAGAHAAQAGGLYGGVGAALGGLFSDPDLKEDISRVGELDNGLPVYKYRYKGDSTTRIGLMADEVEAVNPAAVGEVAGFKTVDYGLAA